MQSKQYETYEVATREDRCGLRTRVLIPALLDHAGMQYPVLVTDVAIAGFAAEISGQLPTSVPCQLRIPDMMPMPCLVAWSKAEFVGCSFDWLLEPATLNSLLAKWRDVGSR